MRSVALEMIATDGLDAFSMHRFADALDLTVGALYRYYRSKAALIADLERQVIDSFGEELVAATQRVKTHVEGESAALQSMSVMIGLAYAYRSGLRQNPERHRLIGGLLANPNPVLDPEDARVVIASMLAALSVVRDAISTAVDAGILNPGDPTRRAIAFWAALRGILQIEKLENHAPEFFQPDALFNGIFETILVGWGASPELISEARTRMEPILGDLP
jgi:AcrR family transcriptional regulator